MKRSLFAGLLVLALALAGCSAKTGGGSVSDPVSVPRPESDSVSVASEDSVSAEFESMLLEPDKPVEWSDPEEKALRDKEILALVNKVFAGYADGTYPEPYEYDLACLIVYGVFAFKPPDCDMPETVTMDAIDYQDYLSEADGVYAILRVEVDDKYKLQMYYRAKSCCESNPGVSGVRFVDTRGAVSGMNIATPGAKFNVFQYDGVQAQAKISGQTIRGIGPFGGIATWEKGGLLDLSFSCQGKNFHRVYFIAEDGSLTRDYPPQGYEEFSEAVRDFYATPYPEEEILLVAQDILAWMQMAEADESWTRTIVNQA